MLFRSNGGYPHPDHIRCHVVSMGAFEAAGDPDAFPDAGEPWQPLKLYYNHGFSLDRIRALDAAMEARGLESPYKEWITRWEQGDRKPREITTKVPCGDFFEVRDRALLAHATQIDPDGPWFRIPLEIQREVWPTEDYELARSLVDTTLPEDDLFAGVTADIVPA